MDNDNSIIILLLILGALAILGIIAGLTSSLENLLIMVGIPNAFADQFGTFLFFLILLGLIVLGGSRALSG